MFGVGLPELLVVLLVCLLLFGANRLPEIGKSLGEGIREFKRAMKDDSHDTKNDSKPKETPKS